MMDSWGKCSGGRFVPDSCCIHCKPSNAPAPNHTTMNPQGGFGYSFRGRHYAGESSPCFERLRREPASGRAR